MLLAALDVDWRRGAGSFCAGIVFVCPGCGTHEVTLWFANPPDRGDPDMRAFPRYRIDPGRGGLAEITVLGIVDLAPCWRGRLVDGELTEILTQ